VALLTFPSSPINGQLFPVAPLPDQYQYKWSSADITWRLLGAATTVVPGCYGDGANVATFCVDAQGRLTFAANVPIVMADWTQKGQLVAGTGPQTQTILDPGVDTSILVVDSASASGLAWSDSSQSAALMPAGVSGSRPVPNTLGQLRYNYDISQFEGYQGASPEWLPLSTMPTGGIPAGGSPEPIFYLNSQIVVEDYTVPAANNAMSAGPITIGGTATVTISAGSAWVIV